jgi:excisionase family DNA binding protein
MQNLDLEVILSRILEKLDLVQKRLNEMKMSKIDWAKPYLSVQDLSIYMSIPVSSVYKIGTALPKYKAGKRVLFKRSEVDAYIHNSRVASDEEVHSKAMSLLMRDGQHV